MAGGCADEPIPDSEKILIESSSSPLGPSQGKGEAPTKDAKPKKPKRSANVVVAKKAGIRFTAPRGWTSLSDGEVAYAADGPRAREFAKRMNVSIEQFQSMMESTDVLLLGLDGTLNVNRLPGIPTLPSSTELRLSMSTIADVEDVRDIDTPVGDGRIAHYVIDSGDIQQYGAAVLVKVNDAVVQLTVTTRDRDETRRILADVVPTIKRT